MFRLFQCLAVVLACSPALANDDYPPAKYDVGTRAMSEAAIKSAANKRAGVRLRYHRVEIGTAKALCNKLWDGRDGTSFATSDEGLSGCQIDDDIVYSYDTPARAEAKHRPYYADMANRFLRHELGHRFGWKVTHPDGRHMAD